jgi:hypothetical protein
MSKENAKKDQRKATLAGAASAVLASKAPKNVLGYEKVYHGTPSSKSADSIRQTGIRKSRAGTGVAAADIAAGHLKPKDVKGKVFTTKNKFLADAHRPNVGGMHLGETLKARVPYRAKHRLAEDTAMADAAKGKVATEIKGAQAAAKRHLKDLRIYKHSVKPRFIAGGAKDGGRRQFATKGNMHRYLSQAGGKARFAKGVAQAAGAVGGGMYAVAKAIKARKEAKS